MQSTAVARAEPGGTQLCASQPLDQAVFSESKMKISIKKNGGEDRIRTCGELAPTHAFQACPLSRSGTSPRQLSTGLTGGISCCDRPTSGQSRHINGEEGGIRTRDMRMHIPVFETGAFSHSATSPDPSTITIELVAPVIQDRGNDPRLSNVVEAKRN